jgi:hypothetical protein
MHPGLKRYFEVLPVLDWLATLTAHIPTQAEHLVRDSGWDRTVSRGKGKKAQERGQAPEPQGIVEVPPLPRSRALTRRWAHCIGHYGVDTVLCPQSAGRQSGSSPSSSSQRPLRSSSPTSGSGLHQRLVPRHPSPHRRSAPFRPEPGAFRGRPFRCPQGSCLSVRPGPKADPYHFTSHLDQGAHAARAGRKLTARRPILPIGPARIPYNP